MAPPTIALVEAGAPEIVLASASPARRALLEAAGVPHRVLPAAVDEAEVKLALRAGGVTPGDAAVALAELKAQRILPRLGADAIVLGADQILTVEGQWFDKPPDHAAARTQLLSLQGRRHELWTAVVAFRAGARIWHHGVETRLWMRACSADFIDAYLRADPQALESVGAYRIEGLGAHLFSRIQGDGFAIQGLPLLEVLEFLRTQGALLR
jgi:septum formation protein